MTTKAFMGWFGPRGLATVLFALMIISQLDLLQKGEEILTIAPVAVALSALLHGVTAGSVCKCAKNWKRYASLVAVMSWGTEFWPGDPKFGGRPDLGTGLLLRVQF